MKRLLILAALLALASVVLLWSDVRDRVWSERAPAGGQGPGAPHAEPGPEGDKARKDGAEDGEESAKRWRATVQGLVRGKYGGLWGARVAALHPTSGAVLAETFTNSEGRYSLELDAPVCLDLAVEPAAETKLESRRREALVLQPGRVETLDFDLHGGFAVKGLVTTNAGRPLPGIRLFAVAVKDADALGADPWTHASVLAKAEASSGKTDRKGRFTLPGLGEGRYRLVLRTNSWMLAEPVEFWADAREVQGRAIPAVAIDIRVLHAMAQWPVSEFRVELDFGAGDPPVRFHGSNGRFARRVPQPHADDDVPDYAQWVTVAVSAEGYRTSRFYVSRDGVSYGRQQRILLAPEGEPNVLVSVWHGHELPYDGTLLLHFEDLKRFGRGSVELRSRREGEYFGYLPPGRWSLRMVPVSLLIRTSDSVEVEIRRGEVWRHEIVLPPGGALVVRKRSAEEEPITAMLERIAPADGDSGPWALHLGERETRFVGIPPGTYRIGRARSRRGERWTETWIERTNEFTVLAGGEATVDLAR